MARPAKFEYLALLDSGDIDESREDELEVCGRLRATDGGRFDEMLAGRAGLALEALPVWAQHEISRCARYATLSATVREERGIALVQAAESLLAEWARAGEVTWALDCVTATWRLAEELVDRPFLIERQFTVVVEAVERAPGVGHIVRTRGLAKFARPDVAMRVARSDAERVSEWVRDVGNRGATGAAFQTGRRISVAGKSFALWPRSEDCLSALPPDEAPLFELREGGLAVVR